jgi:autotransporter translocation and assembly factor TamB
MRRRLLRLAMGLVLLVLLLLVGAVLALRTDPGRAYVLARAIEAIEGALDARVSIGRLRGPVLRTLVLEDVRIRTGGRTFAEVPRIELAYGLLPSSAARYASTASCSIARASARADGGGLDRADRRATPASRRAAPRRP